MGVEGGRRGTEAGGVEGYHSGRKYSARSIYSYQLRWGSGMLQDSSIRQTSTKDIGSRLPTIPMAQGGKSKNGGSSSSSAVHAVCRTALLIGTRRVGVVRYEDYDRPR